MTAARLTAWAVPGIREIVPGDDLATLVGDALHADAREHPEHALQAGDILVVTSKVVSKAEGRVVEADDREDAITAETVRVVATRAHDGGLTRIVENRQGVVGAAAGVDASNAPDGHVLLLPVDPDRSARSLAEAWRARFGVRLGVIVTDTLGRAWRIGQTDVAIGAAGVSVVDDLRGQTDAAGKPLAVTQPAVGDELAALGDLVKGKASGCPIAVVRGAGRLVVDGTDASEPFTTGRSLARTGPTDMFRLGTDEALAEGYRRGLHAGLALAAGREPRWNVVIPFKGGDAAKSRLTALGIDRGELAIAFLRDTVAAVTRADGVDRVVIVSGQVPQGSSTGAGARAGAGSGEEVGGSAAGALRDALAPFAVEIVPDPGGGLNAAVAAGLAHAQGLAREAFTAVLVGDLPALTSADLSSALRLAGEAARGGHPVAFVADGEGTGTTTITVAPGAVAPTRFGANSRALHADAGYLELGVPVESSLRSDVDEPDALAALGERLGAATRRLLG
ncbi:coenzyme F420-0:L-glutamate ligase [Humibacter sp.]|jgi:coenzyme F420-0:L-glutamate ligase/coenzyme F420-1:gamma-L-glutamate ligase|uniref:coenzyme F420-0:L-glutamate ligase n=1 Tax=Humibacter sp. TaxID=1940291 RepID=UPI002CD5ABA2|nr:coenzyme F420-0:L-glutamate ligase [Humibacter sp.]HVX07779.1 coenzyme F420-0:L-glutamate ligase [Humibacter sp.]